MFLCTPKFILLLSCCCCFLTLPVIFNLFLQVVLTNFEFVILTGLNLAMKDFIDLKYSVYIHQVFRGLVLSFHSHNLRSQMKHKTNENDFIENMI